MSFTIYVQMKKLGKQRAANLQPVPYTLAQKPDSVRELLTALTQLGVKQYNERKEEGKILSWLTKEEITVENTIQCFEDGIYRVFAGETELTALTDAIPWTEDIVFTFVRLTMLAGW